MYSEPDRDSAFSQEAAKEFIVPYCEVLFGAVLISVVIVWSAMSFASKYLVIAAAIPDMGRNFTYTIITQSAAPAPVQVIETTPSAKTINLTQFKQEPTVPHAFTLDELNMCMQQPLINNNHIVCPNDPTCKKCIRDTGLTRAIPQFETEELKQSIKEYLHKEFGPPTEEKILVLMISDSSFMPLVLNWNKSTEHFAEVNLVILGTDQAAADKAKEYGFNPMPVLWDSKDALPWMMAKFMQMAMMAIIAELEYNVLMQDADVFWVQDPRPYMQAFSEQEGSDIMCQLAPRWDAQGQCNTGLLYVSNRRIYTWFLRFFWRSLIYCGPLMDMIGDDQMVFNALLRHWHYGQVNYRILPFDRFILGIDSNGIEKNENVITAHMVGSGNHKGWLGKVDRIQKAGLWKLEWDPVKEFDEKNGRRNN